MVISVVSILIRNSVYTLMNLYAPFSRNHNHLSNYTNANFKYFLVNFQMHI